MTNPAETKTVALIAGPTASGKTALALHLAKQIEATIINADSAQVYAPLPLLSARPTDEEMASAPHRLFAYRDGNTMCSAAEWADDAKREIIASWEGGRLPILVGGTGLYIKILLEGVAPIPDIDPDIRQEVRTLPTERAARMLASEDPRMASELHENDSARIKRALEVIRSTGQSISAWRAAKEGGVGEDIDLRPVILKPPRDWIYERCDRRFLMMMEQGAVEEVEALLKQKLSPDATIMRAIGVPEIIAMLAGEISREEAIKQAQTATRQYAKRQYTWFSNQPPAEWPIWKEEVNNENIDDIVTLFQLLSLTR